MTIRRHREPSQERKKKDSPTSVLDSIVQFGSEEKKRGDNRTGVYKGGEEKRRGPRRPWSQRSPLVLPQGNKKKKQGLRTGISKRKKKEQAVISRAKGSAAHLIILRKRKKRVRPRDT